MSEPHTLTAYLATLAAICYLVTVAALLAGFGRYSEAIGVAAAVTGLIGVIKLPSARSPVTNVEQAETVNATQDPEVAS